MLDGFHASEFKDRYGHHHFAHAWSPRAEKNFVRIATFTPRRVGNAPDFSQDGTMPYQGIFAENILKRKEASDKFEAFIEDTPDKLGPVGVHPYNHTDMYSEGIYNATLRASISILRHGETSEPPWDGPGTVDLHIGIFEDPTNRNTNGWTCTSKYFYVSLHGNALPFIKELDHQDHDWEIGNNVEMIPVPKTYDRFVYNKISRKNININDNYINKEEKSPRLNYNHFNKHDYDFFGGYITEALDGFSCTPGTFNYINPSTFLPMSVGGTLTYVPIRMFDEMTEAELSHIHGRPPIDDSNYATPPDPSKNDYVVEEFPPIIPPGFGYQKDLDVFRLYYIGSSTEEIDGVPVVTHQFDLYMATDNKTEIRVQPYMSASCLLYNYQKPKIESELPLKDFIRPKSIYDDRYAHVEHRHANYEDKIERMDVEIGEIWDMFDNYVVIDQGIANKNKVLFTNDKGHVVCIDDNLERHQDDRRIGNRVLVTDNEKCIVESNVTTEELAQLVGVSGNVQSQFSQIEAAMNHLFDVIVKKAKVDPNILKNIALLSSLSDGMTKELEYVNQSLHEIWHELGWTFADIKNIYQELNGLWDFLLRVLPEISVSVGDSGKEFVKRSGDTVWGDIVIIPKGADSSGPCHYVNLQNPEGYGIHVINGERTGIGDYEHARLFVRKKSVPGAQNDGMYYIGMCEQHEFKQNELRPIWTYENDHGRNTPGQSNSKFFHLWKESFLMKLAKITVKGDKPTGTPVKGDIWIKNAASDNELTQQASEKGFKVGGDGSESVG